MQAWRSLSSCYPSLLEGAAELEPWGGMLVGAHLAGAAIETSMLGAAHALANPLTASFGITHGVAIALVLPSVVRWNALVVETLYAELMSPEPVAGDIVVADVVAGDIVAGGSVAGEAGAGEALASHLEALRAAAGLPACLADVDIGAADLPSLAGQAMEQWTLQHNPRPLAEAEVLAIYEGVLA